MLVHLKRSDTGGLTSNTPSRDSRLHLGLLRIWEPWLLSSLLTAGLLNGIMLSYAKYAKSILLENRELEVLQINGK